MKRILGLDLGTNSIGWALVEHDFEIKQGNIKGIGSRIIPMSQDILGKFDSGQSHSQTAERTGYRGTRRLYQRDNLRRERLHRVLNILGFLPKHYAEAIDFEKHPGQFKQEDLERREAKINYKPVWDEARGKFRYEFLFTESFCEMVSAFEEAGQNTRIPHDWVLYYLRKKALSSKISKEELAWIILNFNQKRGYYQLRGEEDETDENKNKTFETLFVSEVIKTDETIKKTGETLFDIYFSNGWKYDRQTTKPSEWQNKTKEFIVTTSTTKNGEIKRTYKAVDSEKDWIAIKSKTEQNIESSDITVGTYIYENLLQNPKQKIRGKLVRTIERKFYKEELNKILKAQSKFHPELSDRDLYQACLDELYPRNEAHQGNIKDRDFVYLFLDDIIFYQRPLKSKKSTITTCAYETRTYLKQVPEKLENGDEIEKRVKVTEGIKGISKSHPLFQEFRLWQFLGNFRFYKKALPADEDITNTLLSTEEDWADLFDFLSHRKEVEQKHVTEYFVKKDLISKQDKKDYRWNYVEDKKYPCNETRAQFASRLSKVEGVQKDQYFDPETELQLWHIVYSVTDKKEFETALERFALKKQFHVDSFVESFRKIPPYKSDYGSYSEKAIKKLLPLMRVGKYWKEEDIHPETLNRIDKIINGEHDEKIRERVWEITKQFSGVSDFKALPVWLACYVVYNRHSESSDTTRWNSPADIDKYLSEFKQHSLRNPIVEQVVTETLRTVRDIWSFFGKSARDYFSEIHVELGREMKNPKNIREKIAKQNAENENTNARIRELLKELMNDSDVQDDVRPYSPSHQEILIIYEDGLVSNPHADFSVIAEDEIQKIRKSVSPTSSDIKRYKLWLEQGYISPYTGEVIRLSDLFSPKYQIEHIIPQARYFDDSLSNKVICESEVNELKGDKTAYEFLKDERGRKIELSGGKTVSLFTLEAYEDHCARYFKNNRLKLKKLMSEDIPEGFIERQMNDSRYISKLIKSLLNNIVKDEKEKDSISYKVVPVTGSVTTKLKQDWGLNDKWNEIVSPRFKRLNEITQSNNFGYFDQRINAFRCEVSDDLKRGFNKKRIDHRHHALDALTIACATREHINYLNSINSERNNYALRSRLLKKSKNDRFTKTMLMPWPGFANDALNALQETVVSFKQNQRIINKTNNKTWQWIEKNGSLKKELVKQTKGDNWAIRKPMHKETVSGAVLVRKVNTVSFSNGLKDWRNLVDKDLKKKVKQLLAEGKNDKAIAKYFKENPYPSKEDKAAKLDVYTYTKEATATRTLITDKFTPKQLDSVTDSGIKQILTNHLKNYIDEKGKKRFDLAFNPDGLEEMNKNIVALNNGKFHQPIYKVRIYEEGKKFSVGDSGSKNKKFVEAAKGTNLFFAIYWNEEKQKREYETIALNRVIEHQKWRATLGKEEQKVTPMIPVDHEKGKFLFSLSPNDLVYIPSEDELENPRTVDLSEFTKEHNTRIYKMVSSSGSQCFFVQSHVAQPIYNKFEFSALNKMEKSVENEMIKELCWKLEVDRLGNIKKIVR